MRMGSVAKERVPVFQKNTKFCPSQLKTKLLVVRLDIFSKFYMESFQQLCRQHVPATVMNGINATPNKLVHVGCNFGLKMLLLIFLFALGKRAFDSLYICCRACLVREGYRHSGRASRRQAMDLQGSPVSTAGAVPSWSRPTLHWSAHYFQP